MLTWAVSKHKQHGTQRCRRAVATTLASAWRGTKRGTWGSICFSKRSQPCVPEASTVCTVGLQRGPHVSRQLLDPQKPEKQACNSGLLIPQMQFGLKPGLNWCSGTKAKLLSPSELLYQRLLYEMCYINNMDLTVPDTHFIQRRQRGNQFGHSLLSNATIMSTNWPVRSDKPYWLPWFSVTQPAVEQHAVVLWTSMLWNMVGHSRKKEGHTVSVWGRGEGLLLLYRTDVRNGYIGVVCCHWRLGVCVCVCMLLQVLDNGAAPLRINGRYASQNCRPIATELRVGGPIELHNGSHYKTKCLDWMWLFIIEQRFIIIYSWISHSKRFFIEK